MIIPIPARHFDLISDCDALGFVIEFFDFALVYTGDTGFTPRIAQEYQKIRSKLQSPDKPIALLAHLGGFKTRERNFDDDRLEDGRAYYKDHLGRNGMISLVDALRPKFCILSEFGEEFDGQRAELADLFTDTFKDLNIPFFPADIGFCLNGEMKIFAVTCTERSKVGNREPEHKEDFIEFSFVHAAEGKGFIVYYGSGITDEGVLVNEIAQERNAHIRKVPPHKRPEVSP